MENGYVIDIKTPISKEMVNITPKEAENVTNIALESPLESPVIKEEINNLSCKVELKENSEDIPYSALMENQNTNSSVLKIEQELDLQLENLSTQSHSNCSYPFPGSTFHRPEDLPFKQKQKLVKIENSDAVSEIGSVHKIIFDEWKIKHEEMDIKEDNLQENEHSALSSGFDQVIRGNYTADQCHNQTIQKQDYPIFKTNLAEGRILKCDVCDYQTIIRSNLRRHLRQHKNLEEAGMFKCNRCPYHTVYKYKFKRHLGQHDCCEKCDIYKCNQCSFQTIYKAALTTHLHQHENTTEVDMLHCDQCNFRTCEKNYLKKHLSRHENNKEVAKRLLDK